MTNTELHPIPVDAYSVAPETSEFWHCLEILDEAAGRLQRQGVVQWPEKFDQKRIDKLKRYAAAGEMMIVRRHEKALATLVVSQEADPDFAGYWPTPAHQALYLYRVAVSEAGRGLHLGHRVLVPLAESYARAQRKSYLRLDCSRTNSALHRHYQNEWGFQHITTATVPGRKSGALFQRPVLWG